MAKQGARDRAKELKKKAELRKISEMRANLAKEAGERHVIKRKIDEGQRGLADAKDKRDRARKKKMLEAQMKGLRGEGKHWDKYLGRLGKKQKATKAIKTAAEAATIATGVGGVAKIAGKKAVKGALKAANKKVTSAAAKRLNKVGKTQREAAAVRKNLKKIEAKFKEANAILRAQKKASPAKAAKKKVPAKKTGVTTSKAQDLNQAALQKQRKSLARHIDKTIKERKLEKKPTDRFLQGLATKKKDLAKRVKEVDKRIYPREAAAIRKDLQNAEAKFKKANAILRAQKEIAKKGTRTAPKKKVPARKKGKGKKI